MIKENRLIGISKAEETRKRRRKEAGLETTSPPTTKKPTSVIRTPESEVPKGEKTPIPDPVREESRIARQGGQTVFKSAKEVEDAFNTQEQRLLQAEEDFEKGDITRNILESIQQSQFTQSQRDAAISALQGGAVGVNPQGFDPVEVQERVGGTKEQVTGEEIQDERRPVGEPFQSPLAGATGVTGATGDPRRSLLERRKEEEERIEGIQRFKTETFTRDDGSIGFVNIPDAEATENAKEEARRIMQERENIEFQQDQASKEEKKQEKEFKFDFSSKEDIDSTIAKIESMMGNSMGIDSNVFSAFSPAISLLLGQMQSKRSEIEKIDTQEERSDMAESAISGEKETALRRERELKDRRDRDEALLKESRDILVEANKLQADALDLDKKIIEEKQRISEARQLAKNIEGEKQLRRSLNAIGVGDSPKAQEFMQDKIQEAADTLESMITTNNLTILKFDNARSQLNTDLRSILNEFDSKRATLNANFDDNIFKLDQFVSGARSSVLDDLRKDWERLSSEEDKLFMDFGNLIKDATLKSIEEQRAHETDANNRKEESWDMLIEAFEKTAPGSSFRKSALDNAKKMGWDVGDININDEFIDSSISSEQRSAELHDVTPYLNDPEKLALINTASAVADLAVRTQVDNQYRKFKTLIDAGNHDEAIQFMKNFASSNMSAGMKASNAARNTIIVKSGELLTALDGVNDTGKAEEFFKAFGEVGIEMNKRADDAGGYEGLENTDFNWYTKELQDLRNKFGMNKTPELQELYAKVQNIASSIIKERYGSAVTEPEMALARAFIAMPGDTLEDMKIKIKEFAEFSAEENRQELSTQGIPVDLFMPGLTSDLPIQTQSSVVPTDSELEEMMKEIESDLETMGDVSYTGRNFVSKEYDGRRVELSRPALMAFDKANEEFRRDFGMDIRVASVDTASTRDQAKTIEKMARENNIPFNKDDPNETAQRLRDSGRQIANVGSSRHEIGEAVDLYPFEITVGGKRYTGTEYIELVKPYLERHGLAQVNHRGRDPGNFEFQTS